MEPDEELVRRALRGDEVAWTTMFSRHAPAVVAIIRANRSMGSYRHSEDDVRNVMARVFERLRRDDFRALRTFAGWRANNPTKSFTDWLTIVTVNVVRNYVTAKLGTPRDGASVKQLVNTLADALPLDGEAPLVRPHMTTKESAARIVEYAQAHLPEDQLAVLAGWLEGASFEDLAAELHLADARAADRLLRATLARLRRKFADA
jgi:DNA-directed RNA polymerase specialized sigma24 family protein